VFEHIKTIGISHALHIFSSGRALFSQRSTVGYCMRNFIPWQWKKITI